MPPTYLIIVAGVCIAIGFLLSTIIRSFSSEKEIPPDERLQKTAQPDPHRIDQMSFYKEKFGEPWVLETDGRVIRNAEALNSPQRQRLAELLQTLDGWVGYPATEETIPAGQYTPTPPVPEPAFQEPILPEPVSPEPPPASFTTPAFTEEPVTVISDFVPPILDSSKPKSIVEQIDDILQSQLAGTALAGRGIRLSEIPGRGVVVRVGLDQYPDIDAVPEPQVRAAIQAAVSTWEQKSK